MNDNILIQLDDIKIPEVSEAVWRLLKMCDNDFVPPLSSRESTVSKNLKNISSSSKEPTSYFEELKKQYLLTARSSNKICGIMSFRNKYFYEELKKWNPSNYVTTICIDNDFRGKGICSLLYDELLFRLPDELKCNFVTTRTWQGNFKHIRILAKFGFEIVHSIADDRGIGMPTLYWAKEL